MLRWLAILTGWLAKQQNQDSSQELQIVSEDVESESKSFLAHLDDLRSTIIKIGVALFVGFNVCLVFANRILIFLEEPWRRIVPGPEGQLVSLRVSDAFFLWMKLSFYGGLVLASPAICYFLADFILPALKKKERALLMPTFIFGTLLFLAGAAICYYVMIPQTLRVFLKYTDWLDMKRQWTAVDYVGFVTNFMLSVGITFEVPLVILMMVRLGVLSARTVAGGRKIMIVGAVIIAAILAPPDPLSMIMMSVPLIVICEVTIWLAWLVERRRNKRPSKA
ncbi:MAG TPA: twin-arginine translocase subunit TatC [Verrucomicrobiae bacterium]|nr:twin-arginine translocase subunit TatC [Verrucomicrobiae bacterium]